MSYLTPHGEIRVAYRADSGRGGDLEVGSVSVSPQVPWESEGRKKMRSWQKKKGGKGRTVVFAGLP